MAALAAGLIVARGGRLVNRLSCCVLVREAVQLASIEGNSLLSNADFGQMRAGFLGEHAAAHAEVGRRLADPDESRRNVGHLSVPCICGAHRRVVTCVSSSNRADEPIQAGDGRVSGREEGQGCADFAQSLNDVERRLRRGIQYGANGRDEAADARAARSERIDPDLVGLGRHETPCSRRHTRGPSIAALMRVC